MNDVLLKKLQLALNVFSRKLEYLPQEHIRSALLCFFIFIGVTLVAQNFWFLVAIEGNNSLIFDEAVLPSKSASSQNKIEYADIARWQLFGQEPDLQEQEEVDKKIELIDEQAQETRLNIKLMGILYASIPEQGYAIMAFAGEVALIKVGEKIPLGTDISLAKVLVDKVIIDNKGQFESLMLFGDDNSLDIKRSVNAKKTKIADVIDKRNNKAITSLMSSYKERLLKDPLSMASVIRISLATDHNGAVIGYRVRPGKDRKEFAQLGLKSGDIITAVNGVSLADQQNAMRIYGDLSNLTEANFDIRRGKESLSIMVNIAD